MTRSLAELRQYLAGEWLFDNDFKDTSGNGNHGTPTDIEWASTNRGLKPRFNGSSSVVNCGNDSSLDVYQSDFTISILIRHGDTGIYGIVSHGSGTQRVASIYSYSDDEKINFILRSNISTYTIKSNSNLNDNENHHIICTVLSGVMNMYIDGVLQTDTTTYSGTLVTPNSYLEIGRYDYTNSKCYNGLIDIGSIYSTGFTSAEALALYNATSGEYGVRIAEFSHQHDPAAVIPVQTGEVLRIGGKLAGDAVNMISDRALSNDAEIHGPMPTGDGFLAGGRRFVAANENYLDCGNDSSLDVTGVVMIEALLCKNVNGWQVIGMSSSINSDKGYAMLITDIGKIRFWLGTGTSNVADIYSNSTIPNNTITHVVAMYDKAEVSLHINGVLQTDVVTASDDIGGNSYFKIGGNGIWYIDAKMYFINVSESVYIPSARFNTLAILPFWSISYADYPDNVTTYTDRFPHSSSIIASGTFKVDDDKLTCTSAGTLTYSASHEFDGQEYITVTIAGTEYSGTGTITQGNTTVSVAQGSNKITVTMGTGDTIDKIRIQFRATV